jgi:hypothetical protein
VTLTESGLIVAKKEEWNEEKPENNWDPEVFRSRL